MPKPIIIAGPTASGKTDIALALAAKTNGIIISADSRQVYKGLSVGTAAPVGIWEGDIFKVQDIPYYLTDFLDINDKFDVSKFVSAANQISAANKGRQIIFAGGTGMYLQGYFCGLDNLPQADEGLRAEFKALADKYGKEYLHEQLAAVDAVSAAQIPAGNIQRTMRALEIYRLAGKPASELRSGKFYEGFDKDKVKFIILSWDKEILNQRIAKRTALIFDGMCSEAKAALNAGYTTQSNGLKSLGYAQAVSYLNGAMTQQEALEKITILTRQYAKRQRTWFARYDAIKINPADYIKGGEIDCVQIADFIAAR